MAPMTTKPADDTDQPDTPEYEATPIHSTALPQEYDEETAWQNYAVQAINGLYPHMRNGVDYAVGRETPDADITLLYSDEKFAPIDWGKVEEAARKLVEADPYVNYEAQPGLAPPMESGEELGERHAPRDDERRALYEGEQRRSRPELDERPRDQRGERQQNPNLTRPTQGVQGSAPLKRRPGQQPQPPADPYFDKTGKRIKPGP